MLTCHYLRDLWASKEQSRPKERSRDIRRQLTDCAGLGPMRRRYRQTDCYEVTIIDRQAPSGGDHGLDRTSSRPTREGFGQGQGLPLLGSLLTPVGAFKMLGFLSHPLSFALAASASAPLLVTAQLGWAGEMRSASTAETRRHVQSWIPCGTAMTYGWLVPRDGRQVPCLHKTCDLNHLDLPHGTR